MQALCPSPRLILLIGIFASLTCSDQGRLPSPTVRVDLSHRLPEKPRRQFAAADTSHECSRKVTLAGQGASQRFVVTWRLFRSGERRRFITAVQVAPDGPFEGGRGPRASASVGPTRGEAVPVTLRWSATRGCGAIRASTTVTLRTDDPTCKPPRLTGGKIFK